MDLSSFKYMLPSWLRELGFPELQESVFTIGGNQVLMRVMCNTNHILLMDRQSSLQFASDCAETVEHKVLPHTVDPFTPGGEGAANEVTAFSLTGAEASDDLSLHVHDDHCVGPVAHHKVLGFLGSRITLLTVISVPAVLPRDLKVFEHSVVFIFQIFTVPSEDALMM